jgi:hypothetical protein
MSIIDRAADALKMCGIVGFRNDPVLFMLSRHDRSVTETFCRYHDNTKLPDMLLDVPCVETMSLNSYLIIDTPDGPLVRTL